MMIYELKRAISHNGKRFYNHIRGIENYNVNFKTTPRNPDNSLVADIEVVVKNMQPSIMIMFTEQNRNWFDKIFLSSKSAEYSFHAKVPLLVFHKS